MNTAVIEPFMGMADRLHMMGVNALPVLGLLFLGLICFMGVFIPVAVVLRARIARRILDEMEGMRYPGEPLEQVAIYFAGGFHDWGRRLILSDARIIALARARDREA